MPCFDFDDVDLVVFENGGLPILVGMPGNELCRSSGKKRRRGRGLALVVLVLGIAAWNVALPKTDQIEKERLDLGAESQEMQR